MADQNNCEKPRKIIEEEIESSIEEQNQSFYEEPSENSKFYGLESHFNETVVFYKNVRIHGELKFNNANFLSKKITFKKINVLEDSDFYGDVYIDKNLNAGIVTARKRLDVGCGGTTLRADASTSRVGIGTTTPRERLDVIGTTIVSERVGIGSTQPQQRLDIAGSVKIDETIYDSANAPGRNGYYLVRDDTGVRWIPLIAEAIPGVPGISTDGIFVLDEGVPLYPS
jgi:hypothetical protein